MSFPKYGKYKDSGVEWLGNVPEQWEVIPLKHLCSLLKDGTHLPPSRVDAGIPLLSVRNIVNGEFVLRGDDSMISKDSYDDLCRSFVPSAGDVLLAIVGATLGKTAVVREGLGEFHIQRSLGVFRVRAEMYCTAFLNFVFQSGQFQKKLWELVGYSAQPGIYLGTLQAFRMPLPPLEEQTAIASFLDAETSKIDGLVGEQRRLIELLKEKRQAVISHAVTKGLNPNAPLKPSNIQWLGDVPEHWEVMKLGRVTLDRCDGPFGSGLKSSHYADDGIRVIRLNNIRHNHFDDSDAAFIDPVHYNGELGGGHDVVAGDLLIAGLGDAKNAVGRACVAPQGIEPAMVKADCFRYRLNEERVLSSFMSAQLTVGAPTDAGLMSTGTTRSRMPLSVTSSRKIAFPTLDEQRSIAEFIDARSSSFDALTGEAEAAIELLQERRTALISAAVTGKIDVREFT